MLKGRRPDISYFHVFGCIWFILNQKDKRSKFEAKADEGIFLGYSSVSKAYRVFNKHSETVEESPHVTFEEDAFPSDAVDHPASILEELIATFHEESHLPLITLEDTAADAHPAADEHEDQCAGDNSNAGDNEHTATGDNEEEHVTDNIPVTEDEPVTQPLVTTKKNQ